MNMRIFNEVIEYNEENSDNLVLQLVDLGSQPTQKGYATTVADVCTVSPQWQSLIEGLA